MLVRCKNNIDKLSDRILKITISKAYTVIYTDFFGYKISDDTNREFWYSKDLFYTQDEWRQIQLNKIV
jgi:hypothetical protein